MISKPELGTVFGAGEATCIMYNMFFLVWDWGLLPLLDP